MGDDSWVDDLREKVGREDRDKNSLERETNSGDGGEDRSSWIDGILEEETQTEVDGETIQNPKSEQGSRVTILTARTRCRSCGSTTVRGRHPDCDAPIIYIGNEWRCCLCGAPAPPEKARPGCGSSAEREPVEGPLDFPPAGGSRGGPARPPRRGESCSPAPGGGRPPRGRTSHNRLARGKT